MISINILRACGSCVWCSSRTTSSRSSSRTTSPSRYCYCNKRNKELILYIHILWMQKNCISHFVVRWSVHRWSLTFRPTSLFSWKVLGQSEHTTSLHISVFNCMQWDVHLETKPMIFLCCLAAKLCFGALLKSIFLEYWQGLSCTL